MAIRRPQARPDVGHGRSNLHGSCRRVRIGDIRPLIAWVMSKHGLLPAEVYCRKPLTDQTINRGLAMWKRRALGGCVAWDSPAQTRPACASRRTSPQTTIRRNRKADACACPAASAGERQPAGLGEGRLVACEHFVPRSSGGWANSGRGRRGCTRHPMIDCWR